MNKNRSWFTITFEWNSLVKDLIRNFWAIILAGVIAYMGISVVEKSVYTPIYKSSAVLVVRSKVGSSGIYSNLSASTEMATIFTRVFDQPSMKSLAAENLGLDSFDGTISAEVSGTTNLMNISVEAEEPELAFRLLTSVLEVYPNISDAVFTNAVVDVISDPQMPTRPSNSVLTRYRNHIVLLAMALEAGLIVLLSLLRETVKEERGFSDKIDSQLVATVSHERPHLSLKEKLKRKKRSLLINDAYSSLKFTEDYQKLATKLEYMQKNKDQKVFAVTSVAENEGKSTVAANVSLALSGRGYRVALIDLDIRKPSMYKIFDYSAEIKNEFSDVLANRVTLNDFSFVRYRKSDLIIAFSKSSNAKTSEDINGDALKSCIAVLREKVDFVIIDTPPSSVSADSVMTASMVDRTLLVVRVDCVGVRDINDAILAISDAGGKLAGCILNDVYKPFTLFGQMGVDETGYHGYNVYQKGYSRYGRMPLAQEGMGEGFTEESLDDTTHKI